MKKVKIRKKADIVTKSDSEVGEIELSIRLSKVVGYLLLKAFPNLRRIYLPPSLYESSPHRVIEALSRVGVEVLTTRRSRGRPPKYSDQTLKILEEKYRSGESPSKISADLGIPIRTVYYILRKLGLRKNAGQR